MQLPRRLLLVSVGNSSTRFAHADQDRLEPSHVCLNTDSGALQGMLGSAWESLRTRGEPCEAILCSVNAPVAADVERWLVAAGAPRVLGISLPGTSAGGTIPVPIRHALPSPLTVGLDRLLAALGAYSRSGEACVVVDAGTAVTVDFIDQTGTFRGGVIAPGLRMMLASLHERTAALPLVSPPTSPLDPAEPGERTSKPPPFGVTTEQAILLGVTSSIIGLVHRLIDRYAEHHGSYPRVIATGGDAPLLFQHDELIEAIVPDLLLIGMLTACRSESAPGARNGFRDHTRATDEE